MECPNCGSRHATWDAHITTRALAGQLTRLSEVSVWLILGCDECSETLAKVPVDDLLTTMGIQTALTEMWERKRR